jgi:hypothetical protein
MRKLIAGLVFAVCVGLLSGGQADAKKALFPTSDVWFGTADTGIYYGQSGKDGKYYYTVLLRVEAKGVKNNLYRYGAEIYDENLASWWYMHNEDPNIFGSSDQAFTPDPYDASINSHLWSYSILASSTWGQAITNNNDGANVRGYTLTGITWAVDDTHDDWLYFDTESPLKEPLFRPLLAARESRPNPLTQPRKTITKVTR